MHVDPPSLRFRDLRPTIRGDSSAAGVKLRAKQSRLNVHARDDRCLGRSQQGSEQPPLDSNLVEFNTDANGELVAVLELSNVASFATKASHFAVYNNLAGVPSLAAYPGAFPGKTRSPAAKR